VSAPAKPKPSWHAGGSARWQRLAALVRKETYQLFRDPSAIAIGVVMPMLLILLFGFALSLDVEDVPVAVVLEQPSPAATELAAGFALSPYFATHELVSMRRAQELLLQQKVDGIIRIRPDFAKRLSAGNGEAQILVYGTDANRARIIEAYAQGAIAQFMARRSAEGFPAAGGRPRDGAEPAVVQRGRQQPLLPGSGTDRADHDADRRIPDHARHGARVGAGHA
jgi:ABC-2 type transport system permease protein